MDSHRNMIYKWYHPCSISWIIHCMEGKHHQKSFMDVYGDYEIYMDLFYGIIWIYMDFLWIYMELYGFMFLPKIWSWIDS